MDVETIRARREAIRNDAPCEGCGSTLAACKANRGKDPTAPPWFGCCAWGLMLSNPCHHVQDPRALKCLLDEIESGHVRTVEETLLDSITETSSTLAHLRRLARSIPPEDLAGLIHPSEFYAREESR